MDRRPKAPIEYKGYGSGAATPEPVPTPTAPQRTWQPTVSRGRTTTTIPQADMPAPTPARTPVKVSRPKASVIPTAPSMDAPTPSMDPGIRRRVAATATAAKSGVGGFYDRTVGRLDRGMTAATEKIPTAKGKTLFKNATSSYNGKLGKVVLVGDIQAVIEDVNQVINPDATAELIFNARPQDYASIEDAKAEVRAFNIGEAVGTVAEAAVVGGITTGIMSLGPVAALAAGTIGGILMPALIFGAVMFAATLALDAVDSSQLDPNKMDRNALLMNPDAAKEATDPLIQGPVGSTVNAVGGMFYNPHGGGPVQSLFGALSLSELGNKFKDDFATVPGQLSREEVTKRRSDRGFAGEVSLPYADGTEARRMTLYKTFGDRAEEVGNVLTTGYFMKPTGYTFDVPDGNGGYQTIREFDLDYESFNTWFEDTDWMKNGEGILQRVFKIPPIDSTTLSEAQKSPITTLEARYALKFWYDLGKQQQEAP